MRVKIFLLVAALAYTTAIAYLSLINLADTPVSEMGFSDKIMHAGAYFGLGLLWLLYAIFSFRGGRLLAVTGLVVLLTSLFGIFIEVLQERLTTYREFDFYDVLANSAGIFSAGLLVWVLRNSLTRVKAKINLFFMKN